MGRGADGESVQALRILNCGGFHRPLLVGAAGIATPSVRALLDGDADDEQAPQRGRATTR